MTMKIRTTSLSTLAAAVLSLALAGCDRNPNAPVGTLDGRPDSGAARAPDGTRGADAPVAGRGATDMDARTAGGTGAGSGPSNPNPNPVADAGITSSVRAALTRDPDLRATRVEVETVDGRVALTGEVPSAEARERATQIASAVAGVRSVDNRLKVGTG